MKYELKIDYKKNLELDQVIQKSYFEDGTMGKLVGKKSWLTIHPEDPDFDLFKGLSNHTVKLINEELIEGSFRCIVDEQQDGVTLHPISNYCIVQDGKYSFY